MKRRRIMMRELSSTVNTKLRKRINGLVLVLALCLLAAPRFKQFQATATQAQTARETSAVRAASSNAAVTTNGTMSEVAESWAAQETGAREVEFRVFYADFLAAARANDKEKLADLIAFPVRDWSMLRNRLVTSGHIKDRADFLTRYTSLFTTFMRLHIPRAKLAMLKDGRYLLSWHDVDTEYGFEFDYVAGAGYRVLSYSIGPY